LGDWDDQIEKLKDPYAHLPLMRRPDYVYRPHHHVRARRVQVGDIVLEREHGTPNERWTVSRVEEDVRFGIVYVWYQGRDRKTALGRSTERVWVARREEYPPKETP
jgi:hypothetical protein